jgi:tetratricopeptide (TPR) repeat protein
MLSGPCLAGTIIVNGAVGHDCYLGTMLEPTPENNRKAINACNEAVLNSQDDQFNLMAAYVNRADVRLRMLDFEAAVADSEKAIALDSNQPVAQLNRGAGMVGMKRYQDAVEALNQAITLNIDRMEVAYFNRALAREGMGDIQGAYQDYKKSLELNPKFALAAQELTRFTVVKR